MNPIKILLVDDSKSARYALRLQLQRHAAEVETADSAENALGRIKEEQPDAIFMDHTMPGMNGFEALDILKADPGTASIPVVMCTSNEDPEFLAQAHRKGALDVLAKSTAQDKLPPLIERIRQIVSGAPAQAVERRSAPAVDAAAISEIIRRDVPRLIEERLDAILEQRVEAALMPLLAEFGDRLTADVQDYADRRISEGLDGETKRLQRHFIGVQNEQARLSANRLTAEVLPQAVSQQFEKERNNLAQMVQEFIDHTLDGVSQEPAFMRRVLDMAEVTAMKVADEAAKKHARELADKIASERASMVAESFTGTARTDADTMYVLAGVAALVGIAASGFVYLLLS